MTSAPTFHVGKQGSHGCFAFQVGEVVEVDRVSRPVSDQRKLRHKNVSANADGMHTDPI